MEKCAFFVKKRGRQCRMTAAKGSIYCGEHLIHDDQSATGASSIRKRIPCPLDPSHTIYEDTLKKHLKKCNASPHKKPMPACYSPHINSGLLDYQPSPEESLPLSSFPEERVRELTQRVEKAYQAHFGELQTQVFKHPALDKVLSDPVNGPSVLKHLNQQSSILGHLKSLGLLTSNDTCYVEFGAGRGKLSECIQKCVQTQLDLCMNTTAETKDTITQDLRCNSEKDIDLNAHDECRPSPDKRPRYESTVSAYSVDFVLIDRASCRRKVDGSNKVANLKGIQYHRLLMDIEHLDLSKVECLSNAKLDRIVAISKHLCGAATDLSLRCLVNTLSKNMKVTEEVDKQPPTLKGILVALCCHHRCNWAQLVGRGFFEKLGFSPTDFHLLCHMSSWAVCGVRPPKRTKESIHTTDVTDRTSTHKTDISVETAEKEDVIDATTKRDKALTDEPLSAGMSESGDADDSGSKRSSRWGYVAHLNESIGLKCKRLIDLARLSYLEENGFDSHLVYYIERATSLENVLLIAIPK